MDPFPLAELSGICSPERRLSARFFPFFFFLRRTIAWLSADRYFCLLLFSSFRHHLFLATPCPSYIEWTIFCPVAPRRSAA